jgi:hypothetical protein
MREITPIGSGRGEVKKKSESNIHFKKHKEEKL